MGRTVRWRVGLRVDLCPADSAQDRTGPVAPALRAHGARRGLPHARVGRGVIDGSTPSLDWLRLRPGGARLCPGGVDSTVPTLEACAQLCSPCLDWLPGLLAAHPPRMPRRSMGSASPATI